MKNKPNFLIFGYGYTASYLTPKLQTANFHVVGTSRKSRPASAAELISFTAEEISKKLQETTHVLISTPPDVQCGDPVLAHFTSLLQKHASQLKWLGYLSTTGVYGDHQGAWVDEQSRFISPGKLGQLRIEAERGWLKFAQKEQIPLHIFRLAGIYGPQRNALERILSGKSHSIYKPGHFFSRIHVEDLVTTLLASIKQPNPFSIYNVADDEPAESYLLDAYACDLLQQKQLPLLSYDSAELSIMEQEFYAHNRRVSNTKIKNELKIKLDYPSYREGLLALKNTCNIMNRI